MILPGYTHMQRRSRFSAASYWLAYCEKFERDRARLADCQKRVNVLPLGVAALAGTSLPIDRHDVAQRLGFVDEQGEPQVAANSLDASSDRDFVIELAFALAMIAEHLSGWAEEWILWSTAEFNFLKPPEYFCTGSSIMPQKIESGRAGIGARQNGACNREFAGAIGFGEGIAACVQPGFARRQAAVVRFGGYRADVAGDYTRH